MNKIPCGKVKALGLAGGILLCLAAGCSKQQVYESIQSNRLQDCQKLPIPQQQACVEAYEEDFEGFQQKREELLEQEAEAY